MSDNLGSPPIDESSKYNSVEKPTEHPLEGVFDIEGGSTLVPYEERMPVELVDHESYDAKDKELEEQLQEVTDLALEAFENQSEASQDVDPQFKARNQEVAAVFLNTALSAITQKATLKRDKDKLEKMATKGGAGTTNNIIVDRNDLLRAIQSGQDQTDAIDGEFTEDD